MAEDPRAKKLTEKHRVDQLRLASRVEADIRRLRPDLDVDDLSGSWRFRAHVNKIVEDGFSESVEIAAQYMERFPLVEAGVSETIIRPVYNPYLVEIHTQSSGIAVAKRRIGQGATASEATGQAVNALAATVVQDVLAGGRSLIDSTVRYSGRAGGYRRVTDSKPCAFCAMLASRGPVYSQESAFFESHGHCGCTAEPVYRQWQPSEVEWQWRESYKQAATKANKAGELRTAKGGRDTILWRMRRNSPELFSDGVFPKK